MITLHGAHTETPPEVSFGRHGYKKVERGGVCACIISADGTNFRVGTKVVLIRKHGNERLNGLGDIPLQTRGHVVELDPRSNWAAVLRVRFPGFRGNTALSVRPDEVALFS